MRSRMLFGSLVALLGLVLLNVPSMAAMDPYDVPVIECGTSTPASITLDVCGGASTGAPAGLSIQWMTLEDYNQYGWDNSYMCALSLSGQPSMQHPGKSRWELLPGECETITIGDINFDETGVSGDDCAYEPLRCGTEYVFRWFAHAGRGYKRSDWGGNLVCYTEPCTPNGDCTYTQGYWKTHGPTGCQTGNNENEWPVASLTLGTVGYTDAQLCSIFNKPAAGNGLITLAHQLIAAKLNIANGADPSAVAGCIMAADDMIGNLVVPPVGSGSLTPGAVSPLVPCLTYYNEGAIGPGHCDDGGGVLPTRQSNEAASPELENSTWGNIKATYK